MSAFTSGLGGIVLQNSLLRCQHAIIESEKSVSRIRNCALWLILESILRVGSLENSFATWGNSGIVPDEGTTNQLSRKHRGPPHVASERWRAAMWHYVGLDVSLKQTSICVVNETGSVVRGCGRF